MDLLATAHETMGSLFERKEQYEQAALHFKEALSSNPTNTALAYKTAQMLRVVTKDVHEAVAFYQMAATDKKYAIQARVISSLWRLSSKN